MVTVKYDDLSTAFDFVSVVEGASDWRSRPSLGIRLMSPEQFEERHGQRLANSPC
jgi:hypothetical protein